MKSPKTMGSEYGNPETMERKGGAVELQMRVVLKKLR